MLNTMCSSIKCGSILPGDGATLQFKAVPVSPVNRFVQFGQTQRIGTATQLHNGLNPRSIPETWANLLLAVASPVNSIGFRVYYDPPGVTWFSYY